MTVGPCAHHTSMPRMTRNALPYSLSLILLACAAQAQPTATRTVADLTRMAAIEPIRIQMESCARLYPQQSASYATTLARITALVDGSLQKLSAERAKELQAAAPEAMFLFQDGLLGQYRSESQALTADRCDFLAGDIQSLSETEFVSMLGDMVGQFAQASTEYREGIDAATR